MTRTFAAIASLQLLATLALAQDRVEALWAEPGQVANPVAICFDWQGNLYVAETDRAGNAVQDTRSLSGQLGIPNAVEEDLKLHTVEDRLALINRWIEAGKFEPDYFTRTEGRVRRIADTDGDGVADESVVFAGGFDDPLDGIASGVLSHDGKIYFTNIPHLWTLEDTDGDGVSDKRDSLSYGYGVRWCFYGHDLHGLTLGPDGRIYFSIGDRGFNVTTQEGNHLYGPQTGGVFRCWPDGSELELFYQGLRNPQELAFDEFGNLFTGDNNCDSGDKARVHHIVEGGDSGWRQDVQSLGDRGPWNREFIWNTVDQVAVDDPARPAWSLPPVAHVGAGPSGITYYPGVGETRELDDTILMVDFYGSGSTVHAFRMVENGAWFDLEDRREFYKGKTVTDIAWGYDGRLYLSDWGGGWQPNPNGNVFTLTNTSVHDDPAEAQAIADIGALFKAGFAQRPTEELVQLLAHRDRRVRLAAQYEIANRDAIAPLSFIADSPDSPVLQRVHAIWALGMIARRDPQAAAALPDLVSDVEDQIRIQAVKTLADLRHDAPDLFIAALDDSNDQVRFYGALGLGKIGHTPAIAPLLDLLDANADTDPMLRHGAVYALELINRPDDLIEIAQSRGPSARLGAVLALRRLDNIGLTTFLRDDDPRVAIEAVRAIYDRHIELGIPALAALLDETIPDDRATEPFMRRVIEANANLGTAEAATRLAVFAGRKQVDASWRILALEKLAAWSEPIKREGVWGHWVDLPPRSDSDARAAFVSGSEYIDDLASHDAASTILADLRVRYESDLTVERMLEIVVDTGESDVLRANMLVRLLDEDSTDAEATADACRAILDDDTTSIKLAGAALNILAIADEADAVARMKGMLDSAPTALKQSAIFHLSTASAGEAEIQRLVDEYHADTLDPALALDVLEAADRLETWPTTDIEFASRILTAGGNPEQGRDLFLHHETAQCLRCHAVDGLGGTAGPELTHIRSDLLPEDIIAALIEPQASIAPGYATVAFTLTSGESISAPIVDSTDTGYVIDDAGLRRTIQRAHIRSQVGPASAMPAMGAILDPYEARDLVAYLTTLVDPARGPATPQDDAAPTDDETPVFTQIPTGVIHASFLVALVIAVIAAVLLTRASKATR